MSGNKPDLLPCPFCGGEALNVEWVTSHDERGWAVACKNPECLMNQGARILRTEAEAAEAWNRRAERTCQMDKSEFADFAQEYEGLHSCHKCGEQTAVLACVNESGDMEWVKPRFCGFCGAKVAER